MPTHPIQQLVRNHAHANHMQKPLVGLLCLVISFCRIIHWETSDQVVTRSDSDEIACSVSFACNAHSQCFEPIGFETYDYHYVETVCAGMLILCQTWCLTIAQLCILFGSANQV